MSRQSPHEASAMKAALDCVHCGLCLEACPTYRTTGRESASPRGRIVLARGILEGQLAFTKEVQADLDLCLACRACETPCPSGVAYGSIIEGVRAKTRERSAIRRQLMGILTSKARRRLAMFGLRLWQKTPLRALRQALPARLSTMEALLPPLPARRARFRPHKVSRALSEPPLGTVALFLGCVAPEFFPEVPRAVTKLANLAGYAVHVPDGQSCCGALHRHDGDLKTAAHQLEVNLRAFAADGGQCQILCDAAGCGAHLLEADHLVSGPTAKAFAGRVDDALRWLVASGERLRFADARGARVTYAAPCHLHHAQRDHAGPLPLLQRVPGAVIVPLSQHDHCCGAAGIYNLDQPASSEAVLAARLDALAATRADVLLTGNPGCILQWRQGVRARGLSIRVEHPAVWLAEHALVPAESKV